MLVLQAAEDTIAPPQDAGIPLAQQYPDRVKLVMVAKRRPCAVARTAGSDSRRNPEISGSAPEARKSLKMNKLKSLLVLAGLVYSTSACAHSMETVVRPKNSSRHGLPFRHPKSKSSESKTRPICFL